MVEDPARHVSETERSEHVRADGRVPLEHLTLVGREWARLLEELVGDRDLAEIVQPTRERDQVAWSTSQPSPRGNSRPRAGRRTASEYRRASRESTARARLIAACSRVARSVGESATRARSPSPSSERT